MDCEVDTGPDAGQICRQILFSSPNLVAFTWPMLIFDNIDHSSGQGNAVDEFAAGQAAFVTSVEIWAWCDFTGPEDQASPMLDEHGTEWPNDGPAGETPRVTTASHSQDG